MPKFSNWKLIPLGIVIGLFIAEGALRFYPRQVVPDYGPLGPFGVTTVASYLRYHHWDGFSAVNSPLRFLDPLLGWRSYKPPSALKRDVQCSLNSQGWRSSYTYGAEKKKPRIVVTGDSLISYCMLDDKETITHFLQEDLGDRVEIMNMGAPGYGIDQMGLVATRLAPEYKPDIVVLGFIGDDLWRGCVSTFFGSPKPHFDLNRGNLELRGVPVPTPSEDLAAHNTRWDHFKDAALTWAKKSSVVTLIGDAVILPSLKRCESELNTALFKYISENIPKPTRFVVAYFEGSDLPPHVMKTLSQLPVTFVDVRKSTARISKTLGLTPGRLPLDGHPDANTNRIYARILSETIGPMLSSRTP